MGDTGDTDKTDGSHKDLAELTAIDTTKAHAARIYDYMLGGTANFPVDQEAAEQAAAFQGGMETLRTGARMNRDFLVRAVRFMAEEVGIRQFLDIGTGIPNADNVHAVALDAAPDSRIVYVDKDPVVLAHSHKLLASAPKGATEFLRADLRDPDTILERAAETLDFSRPVGIVLVAILHFVPDGDDPYGIVARLLDAVPSGSHLVMSHFTADVQPEESRAFSKRYNERTHEQTVPRTKAEMARFFEGLTLVEPGIVIVNRWYPHEDVPPPPDVWVPPVYAAIGRKP